jgi:hypothetical protein
MRIGWHDLREAMVVANWRRRTELSDSRQWHEFSCVSHPGFTLQMPEYSAFAAGFVHAGGRRIQTEPAAATNDTRTPTAVRSTPVTTAHVPANRRSTTSLAVLRLQSVGTSTARSARAASSGATLLM